ncbi:MAG: PIN domain-containing protein [Burkholderiales bacterium]|jgi:predicted nucleic acid-binding protein|nr:PIN domain-containing protein [Burkholderiales bacterium]
MTEPVFVDTNVLVYWRDAGEPTKQALAAAWLARLWRERTGRTSIQVLSEYYVTVTRKLAPGLDPDAAWDDIRDLASWHPQPVDEALLGRGREIERRHRISWWDSLVVAAAQMQGCRLLLTEDLRDGAVLGGVTVRSPFTLSAGEPPAPYAVPQAAVGLHRPRGRPKGAVKARAQRA